MWLGLGLRRRLVDADPFVGGTEQHEVAGLAATAAFDLGRAHPELHVVVQLADLVDDLLERCLVEVQRDR